MFDSFFLLLVNYCVLMQMLAYNLFEIHTLQVDACIYLWRWDTNIVVSDVDGTITR